MALTFYFGSGSPFAWKVWLALEHKGIAYTPKRLSFDADETRKPEFLAINPRGRVPTIVDDGFALYEFERDLRIPGRAVSAEAAAAEGRQGPRAGAAPGGRGG